MLPPLIRGYDFSFEYGETCRNPAEIMMKSGEVDAIVLHGIMHSGFMQEIYNHVVDLIGGISLEEFLKLTQPVITEAFELPHKYKMPMLVSSFFGQEDGYTKGYQDTNACFFFSGKWLRGL